MGIKTGQPRGRPKGAKNKRTAERDAAMEQAAAQIGQAVDGAFEGNAHALLMSIYKNPANELHVRLDAAKAALPYEVPRLAPAEAGRCEDEVMPLTERLKAYAREDAIKAGGGKVVELKATT